MRRLSRVRIADVISVGLDLIAVLLVAPAGLLLKAVRKIGLQRLRLSRAVLTWIGVLPVRHHYYEPYVSPSDLKQALDEERDLPGIDWGLAGQLARLDALIYEKEVIELISSGENGRDQFHFNNGSFESGDAEYLYQLIRSTKPKAVIEIGSGHSSLIARSAISRNTLESPDYRCEHICIEPYEARWLESTGVRVVRQRVEDVDKAIFDGLNKNDLLFIDSSHIIRPQGDVVTEYLQIIPRLRTGVIVHVHDIFSPRDYLADWVLGKRLLWNEQYLLEAFLTNNNEWRIVGALNLLKHRYFDALKRVCPYLTRCREPGSFYMQKR